MGIDRSSGKSASLPARNSKRGGLLAALPGAALGAAAAFGLARMLRIRPLQVLPPPDPAMGYADALARIARLQAEDPARVNPVCRTRLLTHGHKTKRAVVLLHGLTNCPAQFVKFGEMLHARGMNVLMPRMMHHGLERDSYDFDRLTAEEIVTLASEACDILHGLGEERILLGFSTGGSGATWAAQHRGDLDRAILVAPAISLKGVPPSLQRAAANLLHWLPSQTIWWDPVRKLDALGPPHAYPRAGSHVVSELLRLGAILSAQARRQVFAARAVSVVTNPCDETVDNRGIQSMVREWRRQGMAVESYEFPDAWGAVHDLFDPLKVEEQTARTYPQLIQWLRL